jgi:DNA-binding NtrC family response regulator
MLLKWKPDGRILKSFAREAEQPMASAGRVLVVEDDEAERRALSTILKSEGLTVLGAESADKALGYVDENLDVVLSDLHMGDVSGLDLLNLWKKRKPDTQFILLTGHSSVNSAVEAIKAGAFDYVTKPVNVTELLVLINRAIDLVNKDREIDRLRRRLDQKFGLDRIVGQSRQMKDVFDKIQRAAPVDSTVLILGESGTGKELVAQALHHNSPRKNNPFVAVNCAAVPATLVESELFGHVRGAFTGATDRRIGRFEQADGGTLFIDEVGDFELALQAKLLRVLETLTITPVGGHEDRKVDVRVLAATSRDLRKMVEEGKFREDLFYRLNVVTIELPPLRDRPDDVPILVEHFLKEITERKHTPSRHVSREVMERLQSYRWPGNVRELRNTLESMLVLAQGDVMTERDLPDRVLAGAVVVTSREDIPNGLTMDELQRLAITRALEQCAGNRTHAAARLEISVRTLQRKLRQYQIKGREKPLRHDVLTQA